MCVNESDYDTMALGVLSDYTGILSSVGGGAQPTGPAEGGSLTHI